MPLRYKFILLLNSFSTGLVLPVLSLVIMAEGASRSQLALLMGVYSFTVLVTELPTGVFADLFGRKLTFLLSPCAGALFALLLLFPGNRLFLIPAMIFLGLGRSLASGSMDALMIDQFIGRNGEDGLSSITTQLSIMEAAGLASGSILGGALPGWSKAIAGWSAPATGIQTISSYELNIAFRLMLSLVLALLVFVWVKEVPEKKKTRRTSLKGLLSQNAGLIKTSRRLVLLCAGVFCTGFMLSTIEIYWQPAFTDIIPGRGLLWLLGFLSCGAFLFASAGSLCMEKFLKKKIVNDLVGYWIGRIAMSAAVILFSLQNSIPGFTACFLVLYLFLGGGNIAESTMLNREIPSGMRASMLSFVSLISQLGVLFASLIGSAAARSGAGTLWLYTGIGLLAASTVLGFFLKRAGIGKAYRNETNTELPDLNGFIHNGSE